MKLQYWNDEEIKKYASSRQAKAMSKTFERLLEIHDGWGLCFSGYVNAAGYGYVKEPTLAVSADGWDAFADFSRLDLQAQKAVVCRALVSKHDVDCESCRYYLKFEQGIIIHGGTAY